MNDATVFVGLIEWYLQNKRDLPWRETNDPYKIWVSEIILQQTRVQQGLPYYTKFIEKFPTVQILAKASTEEVLRVWQGLGYYKRALNMLETANYIVQHLNNKFPDNFLELKKLKGVGNYTAAAIASFAFLEPVAVVDGNVMRVIARYFGIRDDINKTKTKLLFQQIANQILNKFFPDLHNQAMMELGATVCSPLKPKCVICPLQKNCMAYNQNLTSELPYKSLKIKLKEKNIFYLVLIHENKIWFKQRINENNNIWNGLYDFLEIDEHYFSQLKNSTELQNYYFTTHLLSHLKLNIHILKMQHYELRGVNLSQGKFWTLQEIENLPKPIIIANYLAEHNLI